MTMYEKFALTALVVVVMAGGVSGASLAGEPRRHVTGATVKRGRTPFFEAIRKSGG